MIIRIKGIGGDYIILIHINHMYIFQAKYGIFGKESRPAYK